MALSSVDFNELEIQKEAKRQKLQELLSQLNAKISKIQELNQKIADANNCLGQANLIPGIINDLCGLMGAVGSAMQKGLIIDGSPIGGNISDSSLSIAGSVEGSVSSIVSKIKIYGQNKYQEAVSEKQVADSLRSEYENLRNSDPYILVLAAPFVPAVTAFNS